jgi:regulator of sigma E protease
MSQAKTQLLSVLGIKPYHPPIPAVIAQVLPGSPAAQAGLKPEDKILAVNGAPINDWQNLLLDLQANRDKPLWLKIARETRVLTLLVKPTLKLTVQGEKSYIGIESAKVSMPKAMIRLQQYPFWYAPLPALIKTWTVTKLTFILLGKLIQGKLSLHLISGPISIAQGAGVTATMGFSYFLDFLALISISLAVVNILPIPMLDGGHLLFYLIELIRGKPLPLKVQLAVMRLGFLILTWIMLFAIFNDLERIFS